MQIATWNINGLRARLEFILIWLEKRQPDIVGFQELKITDEEFPHEPFEAAGYHVVTFGQKSWNGVGIASRKPVEVVERGLPGQEEMGARLITARGEGLSFTTVYCPNGKDVDHEDFPLKLAWYDALIEHWGEIRAADEQAVLCGDFNLVPQHIDSWMGARGDGGIFQTEEERSRFCRLQDLGLVDLFRYCNPDEQAFSWWDYRRGAFHRGWGLRIDLVLGTRAVAERTEAVDIDREFRKKQEGMTASDHAPVIATLR